jgi:hypothetical protein
MKPHKHAALIKAWADGAEIEYFDIDCTDVWQAAPSPAWSIDSEYRIKPQPKPDVVLYTRITNCGIAHLSERKSIDCGHNLKLTICGEHGWLVSAEVIE